MVVRAVPAVAYLLLGLPELNRLKMNAVKILLPTNALLSNI